MLDLASVDKLPPGIEVRIQESVLRRLIDDKVIALKATESQVVVTDAELDTKFQEHKARFRTEEAFQDYLKRSNNTETNMKQDLQRNMLRDRVVEKLSGAIEIGEEEVRKYYDENLKRFIQKEQVKASRILLRVSPKATDAEKAEAMKKADERRQEAEENRAKAQKEKTRVENVLKDRERGVTSRGFKQGGIASKPKKKKAMKRGGLASK